MSTSVRATGGRLARDLVRISAVFLLVSLAATGSLRAADPEDAAEVALGQTVYQEACASCHGANLEGQPNWRMRLDNGRLPAPPHDATGHTWHHPDPLLFEITKQGVEAFAPEGYESDMPGFADSLSDEEIWAVLAFIKSSWPPAIRDRQAAITRRFANQ